MKRKEKNKIIKDDTSSNKKYKIVCPECYKNMSPLKLHDGYIICRFCGLVIYKQKHSLEPINAPGFIKIHTGKHNKNKSDNMQQYKKNNKHGSINSIKKYVKTFKSG